MKTLHKTLLAFTTGTLMTVGANAAVYQNNTAGYAGQPYVGVKVGQTQLDLNTAGVETDNPVAYGIYGGYNFDPNFGVELEYVGTDKEDLKSNGVKYGEAKQKTYGAYGTYRYTFPNTNLYAKGKLGLAQNKIEADGTTFSVDSSKTAVAGGVGLGYNVTPMVSLEAEYEKLPTVEVLGNNDADADLVSVGAHVKF